ncbi:DegT/DnrJ/EryC1/StrS family aminotransferase [Haloimpatiens massiliensis]|uniref:DegT/DnrJ/EryC1/StrS family aminotransferase n=1 Tax=Haloimpatiens massiliensis TaxID=1658110 RepID=UPI00241E4EC1|nr:DegT/DnrJ/EryC1/StrS family aminotransferase [Haloimpatiens massiliensis]
MLLSLGEGGMIVTNNEELHRNALLLHNLGASKKIANQYSVNLNLGWNFRIPELVSAVGLTQLKKINEIISYHKLIGDCFNSILTIDDFIPQKHMYSNHVYWRWVCRVKDPGRFLYLEEKFKDNKLMHFGHNRKNTVNDFELIKRYRNKDNCSLLINANKVVNEILSVKIFYGVKVDEYKNLAMAILK